MPEMQDYDVTKPTLNYYPLVPEKAYPPLFGIVIIDGSHGYSADTIQTPSPIPINLTTNLNSIQAIVSVSGCPILVNCLTMFIFKWRIVSVSNFIYFALLEDTQVCIHWFKNAET